VATFELTGPDGGTYHVDAPDEHAAVAAFSAFHGAKAPAAAAPAAPPPDKYQQAAIDEQANLKAAGGDEGAGFTRRLAHGATLGADSTILAGLQTPLEMIKRGVGPGEGYNYAKAREDQIMGDARKNTGALGTGAEILGGGIAGAGLANAGVTAGRLLAPEAGLLARSAASAADAGALGGVSGAMEGNGLQERATNALKGAALGGAVGGVLPGTLALAGGAVKPIASNLRAWHNPEGVAQSQIARAVSESGQTPAALGQQVADANAAGQPFTLADAMGNPGQRMLSAVTRAPGEGRTAAVQFLEKRQAGQGERVGDIVDQGLGAGNTARQTTDQLTQTARNESAPFYQKALNNKPVWNDRIQQFFDDPVTTGGLREGVAVQRLESLAAGKKFDPNDYAITHFNEAGDPVLGAVPNMRTINLIKKGWDNQLEGYRDSTTGKLMLDEKGRALDAVRRSFLKEVDAVNPDYATARALYAGPAQVRDAVTAGGKAATRGRAADNIARFKALTDPSQQGFRGGYADTLAGQIEGASPGRNKVMPLSSPKRTDELAALSLHQGPVQPGALDPMAQRLAREQTMFETRNAALGGSKTADNLNDHAAMGVDPHLVGQIVTGNWHGAVRSVLSAGHTAMTGNTPAVREAVGRMLLDQGVTPAALQDAIGKTVARIQFVQNIARNMGRGAAGGLAVTGPGQQRSGR
jgi:hypothetical protein